MATGTYSSARFGTDYNFNGKPIYFRLIVLFKFDFTLCILILETFCIKKSNLPT